MLHHETKVLSQRTFEVQTSVLDGAKLIALGWRPTITFEDGIAGVWDAVSQPYIKQ